MKRSQSGHDPLTKIKRLILSGQYRFTLKAERERLGDGLSETDVLESIVTAKAIRKVLRSRSPHAAFAGEKLFVIESSSFSGILIYTKGAIRRTGKVETFYILVSAKRSTE
jgi:hypothetical protein